VLKANELEEYSARELDRMSHEREEAIKAKGGLPYLGSVPVGESSLILQPKVPKDDPDRDGKPRKGSRVQARTSKVLRWTPRLITGMPVAS
jgi:hypothetical protein